VELSPGAEETPPEHASTSLVLLARNSRATCLQAPSDYGADLSASGEVGVAGAADQAGERSADQGDSERSSAKATRRGLTMARYVALRRRKHASAVLVLNFAAAADGHMADRIKAVQGPGSILHLHHASTHEAPLEVHPPPSLASLSLAAAQQSPAATHLPQPPGGAKRKLGGRKEEGGGDPVSEGSPGSLVV